MQNSQPKHVIRQSGMGNLYLDKNGQYGPYENAKRFKSQDAAEAFATAKGVPNTYGLFPCSVPQPKS